MPNRRQELIKVLAEHYIYVPNKELNLKLKQFNDFEYPITDRIEMIIEDPDEFIRYLVDSKLNAINNGYKLNVRAKIIYALIALGISIALAYKLNLFLK